MSALALTLAMMSSLIPTRPHDELGGAIARRVDADAPLFADDADKRRTTGLYVAVLMRESGLDNSAIGDNGASHCAGQIYLPNASKTREGWSGPDLRADADRCLTVVARMLRASIGACSRFPSDTRLAVYARGRCDSAEGQRLSRDRMWLMRSLVAATERTASLFLPSNTALTRRAPASHAVVSRFCLPTRRIEASS